MIRKVAHLTSVHPAWDTRIAYHECATLAEAGYDVVLIAAGQSGQPLPAGVRLHAVPAPKNRLERMTKTIWQVFRAAYLERADLYHFHDPELMGVGIALRLLGSRVVFDVHEDIPQDIADKPWIVPSLRAPLAALATFVLNTFQRSYNGIVTATPAIARRFRHQRTVVVHNYPRLEELPPVSEVHATNADPVAMYLGSITELRCIEEMVRASAIMSERYGARLRLAGTFENADLEERIKRMPEWKSVQYLGYCSREEAIRWLSKASVGLLLFRRAANHDECMPTKLFEYLGAGLPVIISDTMQCSEVVRENRCGIVVDPQDVQAVASAVDYILRNPTAARAMGERGRRLVMERYQWKSEANKLTRLYAEIA